MIRVLSFSMSGQGHHGPFSSPICLACGPFSRGCLGTHFELGRSRPTGSTESWPRGPWPCLPPAAAVAAEFGCYVRWLECGVRAGGDSAPEAALCSRSLNRGWSVWLGRLVTVKMLGAGVGGGCLHSFHPRRVRSGLPPSGGAPPCLGHLTVPSSAGQLTSFAH